MRMLVQRVNRAQVSVDGSVTGKIGRGFLVFLGISQQDSKEIAEKMVRKLVGLRIFRDENEKINLDLKAVDGELLIISQFTLYADCRRGNRPSFVNAGAPDMAEELYQYVLQLCREEIPVVQEGIFGADMKVSLENDGPFAIWLDSEEVCAKGKDKA